MVYDEALGARVEAHLGKKPGITTRKMFGGIACLLHGNMCVGITDHRLLLRLGHDGADEALDERFVVPMDFTGRPLRSMVYVEPDGVAGDDALTEWIDRAVTFVGTLPKK